ncbi:MAG: DUF4163 domain-containing protein [Lachnospiraceae bacterium]|nr:DUF4163 domain-containing protein [Lachnospiraceae bacterium]
MKKKIVSIVLALTVSGILMCACSSTAPAPEPEKEAQEEKTETESEPEKEAEPDKEPEAEKEAEKKDETAAAPEGLGLTITKEFVSRTDDEGKVVAYGYYPVIKSEGKDHEKLAAALDDMTAKLKADVESNLDDIEGMAKEDIANGRDLPGGYYTYYCEPLVTRGDENVLSIVFTYDTYSGGAHPSEWYLTKNFDAKTGEELHIANVITDPSALPKVLSEKLLSEYDKEIFFDEDVDKLIREGYEEDQNYEYTLDNSGICFYFSQYQLAPYASGAQITVLGYDEYADLVKEEYAKKDGDYIEGIVPQKKYTASGKNVFSLFYYPNSDDDYEYELDYTFNGKDGSENITCCGMQPYIVKKGNNYYLYLNELQMNDYQSIDVYTIEDSGFKKKGTCERGFRYLGPTDPENFDLAGRTDMLSTNETYRSYRVGDDGMPVPNEEYDHIIGSVSEKLTLKKDIEAEVYADENATESKKETLEKGTVLYYLRTDNETFVDMKTEDGRVVRFHPETKEYPQTVDGTDIEELFDGVMFAG